MKNQNNVDRCKEILIVVSSRLIGFISNYKVSLSVAFLMFKHCDKAAGSLSPLISQFTAHNTVCVKKWVDNER